MSLTALVVDQKWLRCKRSRELWKRRTRDWGHLSDGRADESKIVGMHDRGERLGQGKCIVKFRLGIWALFAMTACSGTDDVAPAEIMLVPGAPLAVTELPVLVIGGSDQAAHILNRVVTPFVLPQGEVVVPLAAGGEIRVFDDTGVHLRTLGRKGEGPGEFDFLLAAWPRGDTIEALDAALRRVTRFLPSGEVQIIYLDGAVRDPSLPPGPLGSGWALGGTRSGGAGQRDAMEVYAVDAQGRGIKKIADLAGPERFSGPEGMIISPLAAFSNVSVSGGRVIVADAQTGSVEVVDSLGNLVDHFVFSPETTYDPEESVTALLDSAAARAPAGQEQAMRNRWGVAPVPSEVPRIAAVVADSLGFAWILPYNPHRHSFIFRTRPSGGTWTVLQSDGRKVGEVPVPRGLEPTYIGATALVGISRDSLGVESVHVHRITRNQP